MAANKSQLTRIFNTVSGDIITVDLKHRTSPDIDWKDAEVVKTETFDCSQVGASLANGNESMNPHTYGIWKALSERVSDYEVDDKVQGMKDVFEQFQEGVWRAAAAPRSATIDVFFVQAVADLQSWSLPQAQAALQELDKDKRKALRQSAKVHERIMQLQKEASSVDTDALASLMG